MSLSHEEAKAFYDRFGSTQDAQKFYEDKAVAWLIANASFDIAESVLEFGCGTGRIAERLLAGELSPTAPYRALDISDTMISLARERLARFGERVETRRTGGRCSWRRRQAPSTAYCRPMCWTFFPMKMPAVSSRRHIAFCHEADFWHSRVLPTVPG